MPGSMPDSKIIGSVEEMSDLFIDTCICTESCDLVFMSVWGRDTVIQELLARITLPASDDLSLRTLHLDWGQGQSPVYLDKEMLEKLRSRQYSGSLFGTLNHLWLFDRSVLRPDFANHSAFVMENSGSHSGLKKGAISVDERDKLWSQIIELAPFPILIHWIDPLLDIISQNEMIKPMRTLFGTTKAWHINLNLGVLEHAIGTLIRSGQLSISPSPQSPL